MTRFTRQQRLLSTQDFNKVFQASKKISTNGIVVYYKHNHLNFARLGLAISKKYIPTAVRRNYIKRVIRETFRNATKDLSNFDIVVVVKCKSLSNRSSEIYSDLNKLWGSLIEKKD